jgi:hypothetical protein
MTEPSMTEAEARRRLGEAYVIILSAAARRRAQVADTTPTTTEANHDQRQAAIA